MTSPLRLHRQQVKDTQDKVGMWSKVLTVVAETQSHAVHAALIQLAVSPTCKWPYLTMNHPRHWKSSRTAGKSTYQNQAHPSLHRRVNHALPCDEMCDLLALYTSEIGWYSTNYITPPLWLRRNILLLQKLLTSLRRPSSNKVSSMPQR